MHKASIIIRFRVKINPPPIANVDSAIRNDPVVIKAYKDANVTPSHNAEYMIDPPIGCLMRTHSPPCALIK